MTSILDLFRIGEGLVKLVNYLQKRGRKIEALQVREALRSFRFSKFSVDALLKLCEAETEDEAVHLVGLIAVRQRDTQDAFREARDVLNEFRFQEGLSVKGEQILGEIVAGKTTVRRELLDYLLAASKGGAKEEIRAILALVITLNERIVELDERLGGLMLD